MQGWLRFSCFSSMACFEACGVLGISMRLEECYVYSLLRQGPHVNSLGQPELQTWHVATVSSKHGNLAKAMRDHAAENLGDDHHIGLGLQSDGARKRHMVRS
jgi:hypothetical protein